MDDRILAGTRKGLFALRRGANGGFAVAAARNRRGSVGRRHLRVQRQGAEQQEGKDCFHGRLRFVEVAGAAGVAPGGPGLAGVFF